MSSARPARPLPTAVARGGSAPGLLLSASVLIALALALVPVSALFLDADWLPAALLAITTVVATGFLLRRTRTPLALIPLAQCGTFLLTQVLVVPRPPDSPHRGWQAALLSYRDSIAEGVVQLRDTVSPAATGPGLIALVALLVFLAALVAETLTVGLGQAGLSGMVLLSAAIVAFGIYPQGATLLALAAPGVGWLGMLWADQQTRLTAWPGPGGAAGAGFAAAPALAVGGAALALTGLLATALLPTLGGTAWLRSLSEALNPGDGPGGAASLDPLVDVRERLTASGQREVLTYRTSDGQPRYLGMVTLEVFDGTTWQPYPPVPGQPLSTPRLQPQAIATAPASQVQVSVTELGNSYLPIPAYTRRVFLDDPQWGWDVRTADAVSSDTPASGLTYLVDVAEYVPDASQLSTASSESAQAGPTTTGLPPDLAPELSAIAGQVAEGADSPYAAAVALQEWFLTTGGFTYSLDVPDPGGRQPLIAFLNDRVGYCQQFSTAFAALARALGIPSRVVVGFANGEPRDGQTFAITSDDAHAWPELWFDGIGWLRFEPTPAAASAPLNPPPYSPQYEETDPLIDPLPETDGQPEQDPAPTEPGLPSEQDPAAGPDQSPGADSSWGSRLFALLLLLIGLTTVAVGLLIGPRLVRRRRRQTRLTSADPRQMWAELRDSAIDAGFEAAPGDTVRGTARRWLDSGLVEDGDALQGVVAAVEQEAYSAGPASVLAGGLPLGALPDMGEPAGTAVAGEALPGLVERLVGQMDERPRTRRRRWMPASARLATPSRRR